ncbi:DUF6973 domain-containing protein [Spirosoma areae]
MYQRTGWTLFCHFTRLLLLPGAKSATDDAPVAHSQILTSANGFTPQTSVNETSIYRSSGDDCDEQNPDLGTILETGGYLPVYINVTAQAPNYGYTNIGIIIIGNDGTTQEPGNPSAPAYSDGNNNQGGVANSVKEDPFGTNSCERDYVTSNPLIAVPISVNRGAVDKFMNDTFPKQIDNGDAPENAIKHALYQALNTCSFGATHTREMAERHEECDGERAGSDASFRMDTHNNNVGIDIGKKWEVHGCNPANLVGLVLEAFQKGDLRKIDGTRTP